MDLKPPSVYCAKIQGWTLQITYISPVTYPECWLQTTPTGTVCGSPLELADASPSLIMTSPAGDAQVHLVLQFVTSSPLCRQQDWAEALDKANNFRQDKNRLGFYPTRIYLCEALKSSVVLTPLLCASLLFSGIRRGSNKLAQGKAFLQQHHGGGKSNELLEIHPKTFLWSSRIF